MLYLVKQFHHVTISVFLESGEQADFLDYLLPIPLARFYEQQFTHDPDHERTKIYRLPKAMLRVQEAEGFTDQLIIFTFRYDRERDTNELFEKVWLGIGAEARAALRSEAMLHVDETGTFYLRIEKEALKQKKFVLTTGGACVRLAFLIAAFPKNMKTIKSALRDLLAQEEE